MVRNFQRGGQQAAVTFKKEPAHAGSEKRLRAVIRPTGAFSAGLLHQEFLFLLQHSLCLQI